MHGWHKAINQTAKCIQHWILSKNDILDACQIKSDNNTKSNMSPKTTVSKVLTRYHKSFYMVMEIATFLSLNYTHRFFRQ